MAFHFPLMPRMFMALRQEDRHPIVEIMQQTPAIPDSCQWAIFLRNHDELTLEMVTDEERDYMYQAYAADPQMRINLGIRRRLAPLLENSRRRIELLNGLLFSLPGTPVSTTATRSGWATTSISATATACARRCSGPATATPASRARTRRGCTRRSIMDPVYGYQAVNVEAQERSPYSLLNWMKPSSRCGKPAPRVRPRHARVPASGEPEDPRVHARVSRASTILVVANLSRTVQPAELDLSAFGGRCRSR